VYSGRGLRTIVIDHACEKRHRITFALVSMDDQGYDVSHSTASPTPLLHCGLVGIRLAAESRTWRSAAPITPEDGAKYTASRRSSEAAHEAGFRLSPAYAITAQRPRATLADTHMYDGRAQDALVDCYGARAELPTRKRMTAHLTSARAREVVEGACTDQVCSNVGVVQVDDRRLGLTPPAGARQPADWRLSATVCTRSCVACGPTGLFKNPPPRTTRR